MKSLEVDAGMRELNATGYMHNRVRMLVASFLCKHLLIDWRLGEAYFAEKLFDFELAIFDEGCVDKRRFGCPLWHAASWHDRETNSSIRSVKIEGATTVHPQVGALKV